jgi:malate synthase
MHIPTAALKNITVRGNLLQIYSDVYTPEVLEALDFLAHFNIDVKEIMDARLKRRAERQQQGKGITFLEPSVYIPGTNIKVQDARDGKFEGGEIPTDLQRQWIQVLLQNQTLRLKVVSVT